MLLIEVILAGVLLIVVLLAVEGEMVLAESLFLGEKERIPPEWEIPEEELPISGILLVPWYSWHLFVGWTGEHRHLCFWFLLMHWFAVTERRICEYQCSRCKSKIGMNEEV